MLELIKQAAQVAHLNVRDEKHGEDNVLALDVKFAADLPNAYLEDLKPGLKSSLYGLAEGATEDMIDRGHLPRLLHPEIGEIKWKAEFKKVTATLFHADGEMDILGNLNNIKFTCKDGGTVMITWRLQILPSPEEAGILTGLLGADIKVTLCQGSQE